MKYLLASICLCSLAVAQDANDLLKQRAQAEADRAAAIQSQADAEAKIELLNQQLDQLGQSLLNPVPPPTPQPTPAPTKQLFSTSDLQLIGGWRVPAAPNASGNTMAFTSGGSIGFIKDSQGTIHLYLPDFGGGGIREFIAPTLGDAAVDPSKWPLLALGSYIGGTADPIRQANAASGSMPIQGILAEGNKLTITARAVYAAPVPVNGCVDQADITNPAAPVISGPFLKLNAQAFAGGLTRIPQAFSDQYLSGKTLGVGLGGYCSGQGSTAGPSLLVASEDFSQTQILLQFGDFATPDKTHRENRPPDYVPITGWGPGPNGDVGYWAADRVTAGPVWIDTPTKHGLLYWSLQGTGMLDYTRQTETFGAGTAWRTYTYDPADIAAVAKGLKQPYEPRGKFSDWSGSPYGQPRGAYWDQDSQVLYVLLRWSWLNGTERLPTIAAYKVN